MNDKQMMTVNEKSFFYKIKRFFNNLFNRNSNNNIIENLENTEENIQENISDKAVENQVNEFKINNNILATPDTKKDKIEGSEYIEERENINFSNVNVDELDEKEQFLKQFEENTEMLELLSIERLKKLDEYYTDIINKNNDIINSLI